MEIIQLKIFIIISSFSFASMSVMISGDGANDVSMIQVADVGVGISGQEGMQVRRSRRDVMIESIYHFIGALLLIL